MNKKLTFLLSVLLILTFLFSVSVFASSEDVAASEDISAVMESFAGKKVSILGDSISTMKGVSDNTSYNTTIGSNTYYYSSGQASKWWQQVIDVLGMELCVNNSWSGSMVLKNNKGTAENNSAGYVTRCVNLHNDTGETPILPDVIWVFLGTNDFTHNQSAMGSFDAIDYDALITLENGTYTYATPTTVFEAYAIMLHKIQQAYPEAEVYCLNLLLRRDPVLEGKTDAGQPTLFNAELAKVVNKAGVHLVDLENCGLESDPEVYDFYITDQNVHPGAFGMDLMSAALLSEMVGTDFHPVVIDATGASRSNTIFYAIDGSSYETTISPNTSYENLQVKVTMGGEDITADVYSNGTVSIPSVSGHVVLTAKAEVQYKSYLQELPDELCKGVNLWTALTPTRKSFTNNYVWANGSGTTYSITFAVNGGDQIWANSFKKAGENGNTAGTDGIRITWFLSTGGYKSLTPASTYSEFTQNGCLTAPDNAVAVNVVQWTASETNEVYLISKDHNYKPATTEGGYKAYVCTVCGHEGDKILNSVFDGGVALEGFSIKLRSTESAVNGLRSISSFDWNKNSSFEADGYTLKEFGAIAVSKANYEAAGNTLTINTESGTLEGIKGKMVPVWKGGKFVGKHLGTKDGITQFALTAVNYKANFNSDVYFCAYSVYELDGEPIVTIVDYPVEDYKFVNLYQLTLDMYINGAINASNTDDTAVWDTLLTGVVTFTEDQYTTTDTDMDGNTYTGDFVFQNVPYCYYSGSSKVNNNIKITLFNDLDSNEYVAIYRGSGAITSTNSSYGCQLYVSVGSSMPNPLLKSAEYSKISTVIIDSGITSIGSYAFRQSLYKTFVYPETLTSVSASVFYRNKNLKTAYLAKATGSMQENEEGLLELSSINSLSTTNFLLAQKSSSWVNKNCTKIHLPSTLTAINDAFISYGAATGYYYNITKIWCGDTKEPEDGIIDLSGAPNLKSISSSSSFTSMAKRDGGYILILPDKCSSIGAAISRNGLITEVRQATYSAAVAEDVAGLTYNTAKYCDLNGKEWVAPTE